MNSPLSNEIAETIALQALAHIAADEDRMSAFLTQTGLGVDELRAAASDPVVLGGVLDFLLSDEAGLLAFCEDLDMAPDVPGRARRALPGGEEVHWT
ncbi:MAG: DUF3572 domain-containing protein [Parvibaculum sp.]